MRPNPTDPGRIKQALRDARRLLRAAGKRGPQELSQALLLQGLLSGDVVSASIAERHRLQKENLRLRQRLTHAKLRTERARARLLERETARPSGLTGLALVNALRETYGLPPLPLLPPPTLEAEIVSPVSPENRSDPRPEPAQKAEIPPPTPPAPK